MEFRRLLFHKPSPRGPTPLVKGRCRAKRDRGDRDGCRAYARRMRGRSSSVFVCRREFRRLRAANYFAHGGSSSQWPRPPSLVPSGQFTLSPLHFVSACRRKLRSVPCSSSSRRIRFAGLRREQRGIGQNAPGVSSGWALTCPYSPTPDPITGDALLVGWSGSSGAQNLSEHLNSRRATGPWVCKIYSWCGSTAAPGVVEPTIRCMCCRRGDPCSRLFSHAPRCLQGTASVQIKTPRAGKGSGRIKRSVVPPEFVPEVHTRPP